MNDQDKPIDQDDPFDDDTIDRIADFLPVEARAGFYRELRHCRSLPQNDEMLSVTGRDFPLRSEPIFRD